VKFPDAPPGRHGPGRTLSTALVSAASVVVDSSTSPDSTSRIPGLSTVLGSAAAHAPPGRHGPGRTLPTALVLAASVVVDPPTSSDSTSRIPGPSTVLGSAAAHAPPDFYRLGQTLSATPAPVVVGTANSSNSTSRSSGHSRALGSEPAPACCSSNHGRFAAELSPTAHMSLTTQATPRHNRPVASVNFVTLRPPGPASPPQLPRLRVSAPHRHMHDVSFVPAEEPRERSR
jgi:hypothetical protein